jgi:hypothetical protein
MRTGKRSNYLRLALEWDRETPIPTLVFDITVRISGRHLAGPLGRLQTRYVKTDLFLGHLESRDVVTGQGGPIESLVHINIRWSFDLHGIAWYAGKETHVQGSVYVNTVVVHLQKSTNVRLVKFAI